MQEEWRPVAGWEEEYAISSFGAVMRTKTSQGARAGTVLRPYLNNGGYPAVNLYRNAIERKYSVHALVARTFLGPCPHRHEINHIDSDRTNPRVSNLEYLTRRDNSIHGRDRLQREQGRRSHNAVLTLEQVLDIYALRHQLSCAEIGERFHVSRQSVSNIVFGYEWAWATGATGDCNPPRKGVAAKNRLRDEILSIDLTVSSRAAGKIFGVSHSYIQEVRRTAKKSGN